MTFFPNDAKLCSKKSLNQTKPQINQINQFELQVQKEEGEEEEEKK